MTYAVVPYSAAAAVTVDLYPVVPQWELQVHLLLFLWDLPACRQHLFPVAALLKSPSSPGEARVTCPLSTPGQMGSLSQGSTPSQHTARPHLGSLSSPRAVLPTGSCLRFLPWCGNGEWL